jgi:hypothetical protein
MMRHLLRFNNESKRRRKKNVRKKNGQHGEQQVKVGVGVEAEVGVEVVAGELILDADLSAMRMKIWSWGRRITLTEML